MSKKWFAVDIDLSSIASEAAEYALNSLEAIGTEIDHLRKSPDQRVRVTGYFNHLPSLAAVRDEINSALNIYSIPDETLAIGTREVEDADWLAEWKKHWRPTEVNRFVIAPPWSEVTSDKILIRIEPNMAFGTGTHETTQLCLAAIGDHFAPEMSLLDVGTGTGILAIAAAKLGGSRIYACDTDADSVVIARDNAVLNNAERQIEFANAPISDETPCFDFVCANLTVDVIVPILELLLKRSNEILLLSGILAEQEEALRTELLKFNIVDLKTARSGEWISALIRKGR